MYLQIPALVQNGSSHSKRHILFTPLWGVNFKALKQMALNMIQGADTAFSYMRNRQISFDSPCDGRIEFSPPPQGLSTRIIAFKNDDSLRLYENNISSFRAIEHLRIHLFLEEEEVDSVTVNIRFTFDISGYREETSYYKTDTISIDDLISMNLETM
jgi:hypothetical protein